MIEIEVLQTLLAPIAIYAGIKIDLVKLLHKTRKIES